MGSPRNVHCTLRTPTRDSCIAKSSRQSARTKAESPDEDKHPASQTLSPRWLAPPPTTLPAASPSPDSSRKSRRSATPDTTSPTKIPHPSSARSPPTLPPNFPMPLEPLHSSHSPAVFHTITKSHRSTPAHTGQSRCSGRLHRRALCAPDGFTGRLPLRL